ncbi:MAG: lycopene cyclase domain-containing protein [Patescibacteria group bacterium]|nr:lycopene cyclase domain-containing protein [Patescibacteria group bacterium]
MFQNYKDAYIIGLSLMFILWLAFFIRRKDLRHEMIVMGILTTLQALITSIFLFNNYPGNYSQPDYSGTLGLIPLFKKTAIHAKISEDIIFWFLINGIAAVIYEEITGKHHLRKARKGNLKILVIFPIIYFISYFFIHSMGFINIIYAEYVAYFIFVLIIWKYRKDLMPHTIFGGLFLGTIFFSFYYFIFVRLFPGIIHSWWVLNKTSGIFLLGIPLEEVLWAFFIGLWVGPAYEFLMGLKDK